MSLISVINYDPAVAVAKSTAATLAMTPIDSTNLRMTFTVPTARVLVRLQGVLTGATSYPQTLFGLMDAGSVVVSRVAPKVSQNGTALTTTHAVAEALFVVSGLTPGASVTWDAAYGVEVAVASSNLRYGGPNNATANDAWGAFIFEVWYA